MTKPALSHRRRTWNGCRMCVCVHMQSPSVHCTISLVCAFTNRVYYAHTTEVSDPTGHARTGRGGTTGRGSTTGRGRGRPRKDAAGRESIASTFASSAPSCGSGSMDPAESMAAAPFRCRPTFAGLNPPLDLSPPPRSVRASSSIASPPSGTRPMRASQGVASPPSVPRRLPSDVSTPPRRFAGGSTPKRSPMHSPESRSAKRARLALDVENDLATGDESGSDAN